DPKCYFDSATGAWFLTELEIDRNSASGAFGQRGHELLAVTSDPTGTWNLFTFDSTDDGTNGTPSHANCPCLGDQPLIGADANGFYISTNEFPIHTNGFNGAQVYAMSKSALAAGTPPPVVHINAGAIPTPDLGGVWYSIQPATSPHGEEASGSEYFLSAPQLRPAPTSNRIALSAL